MSDETQGQPQQPQTDLGTELRELGQQIEQTVRTALETERAKTLKRDLASGLQEIGKQIQAAIQSVQTNPKVQEFAERGQRAVNQAQDSAAFHDLQETLASGIAQLNEKLAAFVNRMESGATAPSASTTVQNVPVEDASHPATGETTRLDS